MLDKVRASIDQYSMLEAGDHVVVGVSGGVDSMALLHILLELRQEIGFSIHVAHVNHQVRGEDALRDEKFVEAYARGLGLDYYSTKVDMNGYAKQHRISSEEAGRILRYGFFREILKDLGGGKIAVAHNLNDQAETLIMRFLRGTGLDGLRGIEFRNDDIIRPILGLSREELEAYIERENIPITEDHTNFLPIYTRNKIRLELIPYIEENFNPNIIATLERTARLAIIDSSFLEKYSSTRYNEIVKSQDQDQVILDLSLFNQEDLSIRQRMIRLGLLAINGDLQGFSESQVASLVELFAQGETGKSLDLSNNIVARINYGDLIIERQEASQAKDFNYRLGDQVYIPEISYEFSCQLLDIEEIEKNYKNKAYKYFDYDKIEGELFIRNRKPGDRFNPLGMKGSKKIKDYFIDEKISREKREKIPILTDDKSIIWVVGYRISDDYKLTPETRRVLRVGYKRI